MDPGIIAGIIITILLHVVPNNGIGEATEVFNRAELDFASIVPTDSFVDKTLLIKTIFEQPPMVLITAPGSFGKSTNMNMVKRFLEIEVDREGNPKEVETTSNYKLFKDNNLLICRHERLFNEHFGKHPVISITYGSQNDVTNFADMLNSFRSVLKNTFTQHKYLLSVKNLWSGDDDLSINIFERYLRAEPNVILTESRIMGGFKFLSKLLHRHFGKKSFVLVDDYDAYVESLIFKDNPDMEPIVNFIQSIDAILLKDNPHIDRALLTGVTNAGLSETTDNIVDYSFVDDSPFSEYYGLTKAEVDELSIKFKKKS